MDVQKRSQFQIKLGEAKFKQLGITRNDAVDAAHWLIIAGPGIDPERDYGSPGRYESIVRRLAVVVQGDPALAAEVQVFNRGLDLVGKWAR